MPIATSHIAEVPLGAIEASESTTRLLAVVNYLIEKAAAHDEQVTHMKLQKLVYLAYGWYLALQRKPLFDETIQAWQYGPIVESLYYLLSHYKSAPIPGPIVLTDGGGPDSKLAVRPQLDVHRDATAIMVLDFVWDVYGTMNAIDLSTFSHKPGSPWDKVFNENGMVIRKNAQIPDPYILTYFESLARLEPNARDR